MLPDLSSPFLFLAVMRSNYQKTLALILAFLLSFTISGCVNTSYPSNSVLKEALALQMNLTERSLAMVVDLEEDLIEVISVKSSSIDYVQNQEVRLFSITGYCDCSFPGLKEKTYSPFQLFLEQGEKGESWRLARPITSISGEIKEWSTYPLPIKS